MSSRSGSRAATKRHLGTRAATVISGRSGGTSRPSTAYAGVVRAIKVYGTLGKFTWRMLATVLAGQAIVIFFGALLARALAEANDDASSSTLLWVGSGLAVLSILGAGLMRRPFGVTIGWLVQAGTFLSAVWLRPMFVVGVIFTGLWVLCLVQGDRVDRLQSARDEAPAAG